MNLFVGPSRFLTFTEYVELDTDILITLRSVLKIGSDFYTPKV